MAASDDDASQTGFQPLSAEAFKQRLRKTKSNGVHADDASFFDAPGGAEEAALEESADRTPPHDLKAEAAVISSILIDAKNSLARAALSLHPTDFYSEAHARIFEAALALRDQDTPVDEVTVATKLLETGRLTQVGATYLIEVINAAPAITNLDAYIEPVLHTAQKRKALAATQLATSELYSQDRSARAVLQTLSATLESLRFQRQVSTFSSILDRWQEEGPLQHEPTDIRVLDDLTGGGPVYGTRWYLMGAPDAGKTALLLQIGHHYAEQGIPVGYLAVDEEDSDVMQRFAQRLGISRKQAEQRDPGDIQFLRDTLSQMPIEFYDARWDIESASDSLAMLCHRVGRRGVLLIDSIQTVHCAKTAMKMDDEDVSIRELVTENVKAVRACATRHKHIAIATSEIGRAFYRIIDGAEKLSDMAAGKESGAIEYSARVMLAMRSVKNEPNLIKVDLPKNKHGSSNVAFYLRIDRAKMMLTEAEGPSEPDRETLRQEKERLAEEARAARTEYTRSNQKAEQGKYDDAVLAIIAEHPGIGVHDLRAKASVRLNGFSKDRLSESLERLGGRLRIEAGARGAKKHYLKEHSDV